MTGPGGFARTVRGTELISGLQPGAYSVAASDLSVDGDGYHVPNGSPTLVVRPGATTEYLAGYTMATGRALLIVDGPYGAPAPTSAFTLEGSNGHRVTITGGGAIRGLPPGTYQVSGAEIEVDGDIFAAEVSPVELSVRAGATPSTATARYRLKAGNLTVVVSGLPSGTNAAVTVTGPNGFSQNVAATMTFSGVAAGTYTVRAADVPAAGQLYTPQPTSQDVVVRAGKTASGSVGYAAGTGALAVALSGLPSGTAASVTVTGPNSYSKAVTASTTLNNLPPGTYTVAATAVTAGGMTYAPAPTSQTSTITIGATANAAVAYGATSGSLAVSVGGLPSGTAAAVTVTGPNGYTRNVTATTTLTGLAAGSYAIAAASVVAGGATYSAAPTSQGASVTLGATASKSVAYATTGALSVAVSGLPAGIAASIQVTGPGSYSQTVTGSTTLSSLATGTYTVSGSSVTAAGLTYVPLPASQTAAVTGGATAATSVGYVVQSASTLNLTIDGMYLTQAVARYDGTTPLVAGRNAYLRVFGRANQTTTASASIRVRFYSGSTLIQTSTLPGPTAVPTTITEGTLGSSWNLAVPGGLVQPNLRILADIDPGNGVGESNEADNQFPLSGTPQSIDVRAVPTFNIRMVPVLQAVNALQGNVTAANVGNFMVDPLKLLPIAGYNANVRSVYTTTAPALQSNNGNGAWGTILSEVMALRSADGNNGEYYFGVVKTSYSGGVSGIGYVGGSARTALGWDYLPSGSGTLAHELGHNMGRPHAPCGGPSNPDPNYPYAGGIIGQWGLDLGSLALKSPTGSYDLMTYCNNEWVSDYNWGLTLSYRQSGPNNAPAALISGGTGLLVWGRIVGGAVTLEPAFRVAAPATAPRGNGAYRVQGLAADGRVLFEYPVETVATSAEQVDERHFAVVVPLDAAQDQALVRLRLVTPGAAVDRVSLQALAQGGGRLFFRDPAATVTRATAVQTRFDWDGATYPMAMVRDAATGEIVSFARGGSATIWATGRQFDVTFSDGVRSTTRRIQ